MGFQLAAFLRTTLPLDLSRLAQMDGGRYHSIWLPDHLVSLWPDSIWTPEFTDLAKVSHSPHRYLDALAVAAAAAALTRRTPIATSVVDTVRRHPVLLAQSAITLSHLSRGRFILGLGSGEKENCAPYGFDFERSVSRFEESLKLIRLLWTSEGPVDFEGEFYRFRHARLDAEPFEGRMPPVWIGANGRGCWSSPADTRMAGGPRAATVPRNTRRSWRSSGGRRRARIGIPWPSCPARWSYASSESILGERDEIREMLGQPLVKAFALQLTAESFRRRGYRHPMGDHWRGIQDIEPDKLTRERLVSFLASVDTDAILSAVPHGTPKEVAGEIRALYEAGLRVATILDYGGMAGQRFAARSGAKLRETEDETLRLINGVP
jgi:phthiodiolone/phenolphthiodiolone dimycocerosates ketoreductase